MPQPKPAVIFPKDIKFRNLQFKAEDMDDDGNVAKIVGHSAGIGNIDSYVEVIEAGAFEKTMKRKGVNWPVLRHHDPWNKIGFNGAAEETGKSLKTTSFIALDTREGKDQYALSKLAFSKELPKAKDAQSIGFNIVTSRVEDDKQYGRIRYIEEIDMWEHSFVTWGANDKAFSTGFKSWLQSMQDMEHLGINGCVDEFYKFMESCGYKHTEVQEVFKKKEAAQNASSRLLKLMDESISIFKNVK